jgi:NitT/TauT family transport system substrate-binding protein
MKTVVSFCSVLALVAALLLSTAKADDTLTVAIGQIDNWENQMPTLGQQAGFFKKRGLVLKTIGTQGTEQTLKAVVSGEADIGVAIGTSAAMRAFVEGSPVRVLMPCFTGTDDLYWYVLSSSPLQTLKEATEKHSIAYSGFGSTSHNIVLGFSDQLGYKARPTPTGGVQMTFNLVKAGKVDIGWGAPPFGLTALESGELRLIARGSEVPTTRDQTVRVTVVNLNSLMRKRSAVERFARAYREALEWMYSDPKAMDMYAVKVGLPVRLVTASRDQFHPREAMQADQIRNVEQIMSDAVAVKILKAPLTRDQLMQFYPQPGIGK